MPIAKVMKSLTGFFIDFLISIFINKNFNCSVEQINYNKISLKTYVSSK